MGVYRNEIDLGNIWYCILVISYYDIVLRYARCHNYLPLSITMTGSLSVPVKPRSIPLTLNVQFLSVADSYRFEQVADVAALM